MLLSEVIGQEEVKEKLRRSVQAGRVPHAQLFSGRMGYGTLALAVAYAQYLNCTARTGADACGACPSCRQMARLEHPDVHFVFPVNKSRNAEASGSGDVKKPISDNFIRKWKERMLEHVPAGYFSEGQWYETVELEGNAQGSISRAEAAEILRKLSYKSFESEYKAIVLWLPERLHVTAANALLKLFEEPFPKTVFLFVTENEEQVLGTILSRAQSVRVPPIGTEDLASFLSGQQGLEPEKAARIARLALGDYIEAQRLLEMGSGENDYFSLFVRLMQLSYKNDHLGLVDWAEAVAPRPREWQKNFLENALRLLRESYILSMGVTEVSYLYGEERDFVRKFAPFVHHGNIEVLVREFELALRHLGQNGSPRIVLTHFALSLSKLIAKP